MLAFALIACTSDPPGTDEAGDGTTESSSSDSSTSDSSTTDSSTTDSSTTDSSTTDSSSTDTTTETGTETSTETTTETGTETTDTGGNPLLDHLVGYWSFNGDSNDHSGLNIDLVAAGDPEYMPSLAAGLGTAVSLDGNDGLIGTDFVKFAGDDATIVAWVQASSTAASWNSIVKNWGEGAAGQFHVGLGPVGAETFHNTISSSQVASPNPIDLNQWIHVAFVLDAANGAHVLYLDGVEVASSPYAPPLAEGTATGLGIGVKPNDDGTMVAQQAEVGYWIGLIDEVGMYDIALTADEVASLHQDALGGIQLDGTSL